MFDDRWNIFVKALTPAAFRGEKILLTVRHSDYIFYQLIQPFGDNICDEGFRTKCWLADDIYEYVYVSQGKTKVDSIDDNEELEYTVDAFNVLGFSSQEKFDCYMLTAAVMGCGGIQFVQKGRDDQAECDNTKPTSFPGKMVWSLMDCKAKNAKNWHTRCARWWNDYNIEHTLKTLWRHSEDTLKTL